MDDIIVKSACGEYQNSGQISVWGRIEKAGQKTSPEHQFHQNIRNWGHAPPSRKPPQSFSLWSASFGFAYILNVDNVSYFLSSLMFSTSRWSCESCHNKPSIFVVSISPFHQIFTPLWWHSVSQHSSDKQHTVWCAGDKQRRQRRECQPTGESGLRRRSRWCSRRWTSSTWTLRRAVNKTCWHVFIFSWSCCCGMALA